MRNVVNDMNFKVRLEAPFRKIMQSFADSVSMTHAVDDDELVFWRDGDEYPLWKHDTLLTLDFPLYTVTKIKAMSLAEAKPMLLGGCGEVRQR